jgi:hypothetical protein
MAFSPVVPWVIGGVKEGLLFVFSVVYSAVTLE